MSKIAVDRAHSWAWAMADVKVSLPLCPARMLNACGICAKLELICVRLVLRMCVRVSGSERLHDVGVTGVLGAGFIYRRSRRGAGTLRDRGVVRWPAGRHRHHRAIADGYCGAYRHLALATAPVRSAPRPVHLRATRRDRHAPSVYFNFHGVFASFVTATRGTSRGGWCKH